MLFRSLTDRRNIYIVKVGEQCDCGSVEDCMSQRSPCTPPGQWSNGVQCELRAGDNTACSTLGLATCSCHHHANSVLACDQGCYRRHDQCLPVSTWAAEVFQASGSNIIVLSAVDCRRSKTTSTDSAGLTHCNLVCLGLVSGED